MAHDGNEAYRAFMDKLTKSNVDEYVNLPMIAVMGDTSSGKSSLLSMISHVELPSNDKLTTRCPIMLQMNKATNKSALVKVIWKDMPPTTTTGTGIEFPEKKVDESNWSDLTGFIAQAQEHIVTKQNKEVARDIVSVEMAGPHCENLTLIDLPGIVRSSGKDESATLSDDIQSLLTDYLKNNRCVILAVLPANVDFHNSQIMAEALKVDPDTKRTIPVLTKPDLIDTGAEGSVKELLLGNKTHDFEMGFHMVKGRGQEALNNKTTIEEGLSQEVSFFNNTDPWRNVEDKSLFGTKNLRIKLGELQMRLIRSSFEEIVAEIKVKLDEAISSRSRLGDIPSDLIEKRALFRSIKDEYYKTIGPLVLGGHIQVSRISGGYKMKPSAEFHVASKDFMAKLNDSRLANISNVDVGVDVIAFVNEKEVKGKVCAVRNDNIYLSQVTESWKYYDDPTWTDKEVGDVVEYDDKMFIKRSDKKWQTLKPIPKDMVRRDPEWIRTLIMENRPYKLPIFINTEVFEGIVSDLIDTDWRGPSLELLDYTSGLMETATDKYVKSIQAIESLPKLRQFLLMKSSENVEKLKEVARVKVIDFIAREQTPYTQNHYLYENISKLRSKRLMDEVMSMIGKDGEEQIDRSAVVAIVKNVFERNQARSMDDHMAEEMQHSLNAYGKVALKRFIDAVPMVCIEIMQDFPKQINDVLSDVMDDEIDQLVVAPPKKMRLMKDYERKIEALSNGIAAIKDLY